MGPTPPRSVRRAPTPPPRKARGSAKRMPTPPPNKGFACLYSSENGCAQKIPVLPNNKRNPAFCSTESSSTTSSPVEDMGTDVQDYHANMPGTDFCPAKVSHVGSSTQNGVVTYAGIF